MSTDDEHLRSRDVRMVYLVTYSQADLQKFETRKDFAHAVVLCFGRVNCGVLQWCCSHEKHKSGGEHYHLALKLEKKQRWLSVKRFLEDHYAIEVNFSNVRHNYYSAWKYVTKEDEQYEESQEHPDLLNTPQPRTDKT